jgi:DNA-binding NtrC family response regulator
VTPRNQLPSAPDERVREAIARVLRVASRSPRGVHTLRVASDRTTGARICAGLVEPLQALGFAVVRPARVCPGGEAHAAARPAHTAPRTPHVALGTPHVALPTPHLAPRTTHVHTAVLVCDGSDASACPAWIRHLTADSVRSHLVIDLRAAPSLPSASVARSAQTWTVRERRAVYDEPDAEIAYRVADPRVERAVSALKRRRAAAGERWLRAALESGRRRHDESLQLAALRPLVRQLIAGDRWTAVRDAAVAMLPDLTGWEARVDVAALGARALIATGDLESAEALVAGLAAEACARGVALPGVLWLRRAEARFWQGRFEEAGAALARGGGEGLGADVLDALIRWACGEAGAIALAAELLERQRRAPGACPSRARLLQACRAEQQIVAGASGAVAATLGPPARVEGDARLDQALFDWLRARSRADAAAAARAERFIRQSGARGITRWGLGRNGMHLLHAMPGLLNVMHDAEDEVAVLTASCRWLRDHARADAAGFVSAEADRWVVADGFEAADLSTEIVREAVRSPGRTIARDLTSITAAPVRWSGTTIGLVLARGESGGAASLVEAASTVAALSAPALRARLDALAFAQAGEALVPDILGQSAVMAAVRESIARAAHTAFPVLIEGESGTGKELVARALHRLSARRDRRLCAVNCAALSDELVEAELFGHARGAFTGAVGMRVGLFEEAHLGTLFLDEVSELSPRAQAKVLRVLQEREIRRVGENGSRPVDVRVMAATNRPLTDAVSRGTFREDLLFRLAVIRVRLPALRERVEDVPLLAHAFARRLAPEAGKRVVLGPDALAALARHAWPGNVRELQNAVAALLVLAPTRGRVTARHVSQVLSVGPGADTPVMPLTAARLTLERRLVSASLARHAGQRAAAARELGLSRQGLAKAIKRLGLATTDAAAGVA